LWCENVCDIVANLMQEELRELSGEPSDGDVAWHCAIVHGGLPSLIVVGSSEGWMLVLFNDYIECM
jgi:hypothetical protein